ncbi:MAG: hypothetical protein JNL38_05660 [Myxococcales bacterium]|nr:hypothetical protein [Myxococcales bacterium]
MIGPRRWAFALAAAALAAVVACSSSESSSSSSSGGASSSSSSGGASSSSGAADGGGSSSGDAGGKRAFGESCADDAECASGRCFKGGTGGGAGDGGSGTASYCSIACTNKQQTDPVCQAQAGATGKCNSQGLCQKS